MKKCGFCITPCVNWLVQNVQALDGAHAESVALHCWGYSGTSRDVDAVARSLTSDYGLNGSRHRKPQLLCVLLLHILNFHANRARRMLRPSLE